MALYELKAPDSNPSLQASPLEALQHSKNCSKESSKPVQAQLPMADVPCAQLGGSYGGFNPPEKDGNMWDNMEHIFKPYEGKDSLKMNRQRNGCKKRNWKTYRNHV